MPKISTKDTKDKERHVPLYSEITAGNGTFKAAKNAKVVTYKKDDDKDITLDARSSRKILDLAREQQEEMEDEENKLDLASKPRFKFVEVESEEEEDDQEPIDDEGFEEEEEIDDVDAEDMQMFENYFNGGENANGGFNLADKIMAKIQEKKVMESEPEFERQEDRVFLPPRVIEAYEKVGESLSAWRHGKLPKLFKVLPTIKNWEDLLYVTNPDLWTPNAVYEATKLFVSNLTADKAQRFINLVLYPRFRQEIEDSEDNKLNYHIYMSLKKSLYKPSAFFKGFLFPLVVEQCSAREAMIVASILKKCSIPVQHSSVALSWLLDREFSPQATVFIRVLLEKKYALPYQTIDDLVFYFMRFRVITDQTRSEMLDDEDYEIAEKRKLRETEPMPLIWHKAFLAFAQRYKNDITDDQRDFLMEVIRQRGHKEIGPEIRRELLEGKRREEEKQKLVKEDDDIMSYF